MIVVSHPQCKLQGGRYRELQERVDGKIKKAIGFRYIAAIYKAKFMRHFTACIGYKANLRILANWHHSQEQNKGAS